MLFAAESLIVVQAVLLTDSQEKPRHSREINSLSNILKNHPFAPQLMCAPVALPAEHDTANVSDWVGQGWACLDLLLLLDTVTRLSGSKKQICLIPGWFVAGNGKPEVKLELSDCRRFRVRRENVRHSAPLTYSDPDRLSGYDYTSVFLY